MTKYKLLISNGQPFLFEDKGINGYINIENDIVGFLVPTEHIIDLLELLPISEFYRESIENPISRKQAKEILEHIADINIKQKNIREKNSSNIYNEDNYSKIKVTDLDNIYRETKYIDELFANKYNVQSEDAIRKYMLELLVEFGEFANETKCFKFWSVKEGNREKILEEYIDCLFMVLYFAHNFEIELNDKFPLSDNQDLELSILKLYDLGIKFKNYYSEIYIKSILVELLHIADLLNITYDDIYEYTMKKSNIIQKRLKSNY